MRKLTGSEKICVTVSAVHNKFWKTVKNIHAEREHRKKPEGWSLFDQSTRQAVTGELAWKQQIAGLVQSSYIRSQDDTPARVSVSEASLVDTDWLALRPNTSRDGANSADGT